MQNNNQNNQSNYPHTEAPVPPQQNRTLILVLSIILGILIVGVIALFVLSALRSEDDSPSPSPTPSPSATASVNAPELVQLATPAPTVSPNTEAIVQFIRDRYYAVQNNMQAYAAVANGSETRYYDTTNDSLVRLDEARGEGIGSIFYYDQGSLYFIYTFEGGVEDRYYFDNDRLVLWLHRTNAGETAYEGAGSHAEYSRIEGQLLSESIRHKAEIRYRVRRSPDDEEGQIGAFEDLQNAKNTADANTSYKVYTMYGALAYAP